MPNLLFLAGKWGKCLRLPRAAIRATRGGEWGDTCPMRMFFPFSFHNLFLNTTVSISLGKTFVYSLALLLSTKIVFSSVCCTAGLFINLTTTKLTTEFMHSIQRLIETIKHQEFYWFLVFLLLFLFLIRCFIFLFMKISCALCSLPSLIFNLFLWKILHSFSF